ncbi:MAG: pyrimidine-nucleoside phosphorylase [Symbiobacteriia bacterium]
MRAVDLILKKRRGEELTREEIAWLIAAYTQGDVPDYQMSAWAMAVCFQGMTARETGDLTEAMVQSGDVVDLSAIPGIKVDKHSTGGVGDKTTLVLGPLVAACGIPVAKMSGRGLGHTGGTLDKLESIPGVTVALERERFLEQVRRIGIAVAGQTGTLVPADGKLYSLRDVTGTVESLPLIASSIMSKKIAGGAGAIVLDVKVGSGAFMKTPAKALELAQAMVAIGEHVGRETVAVITNMDQPLGHAVGNTIEVLEAADTLAGRGPADLTELCLALGTQMLRLGKPGLTEAEAGRQVRDALASGRALKKFHELVAAQGGDPGWLHGPAADSLAPVRVSVQAQGAGHVAAINAEAIGLAAMSLGAGRAAKADPVDPGVGILVRAKVGEAVIPGQELAVLLARDGAAATQAAARVLAAYRFSPDPVTAPQLLRSVVRKDQASA